MMKRDNGGDKLLKGNNENPAALTIADLASHTNLKRDKCK